MTLNLEQLSGLPLTMDEAGQLIFDPNIVIDETKARLIDDLTPVLLHPDLGRGNDEAAYWMYNGIYHKNDADRLANVPMRYELTLLPPLQIGNECVKTFGHRHIPEPESGLDYAEVCEVLVGTAHFFMQTLDPAGLTASTAFYIEAKAGDKIILPPGLDHCTINPGPEPLLFSDVIALGVSGIYDRYRATRGAVYLEVIEDGQPRFIPNPTYREVPRLEKIELKDYPALHLTSDEPLYNAFVEGRGENWPFLLDPRRFWSTFPDLVAEFRV